MIHRSRIASRLKRCEYALFAITGRWPAPRTPRPGTGDADAIQQLHRLPIVARLIA
ncbi:hypothetical protein ACXIZN_25105 [Amycolatopsis sp. TRM77291]